MVGDRPRHHTHGADHGVLPHGHSGQHHSVVGDPGAVADDRAAACDTLDVLDVVGMRVDVRVVGDRHVVADDDLAAVVEQDVAVDRGAVADGDVVAE